MRAVDANRDVPVVTTLRGVGYRLSTDCAVEIVEDPARMWPNG
ncbi:hypothetical protein [Verrucosispora sp. WMMD573]|nr:hypothetical protein [Verrucosispora sp. WMMD573]WBB55632.1 hypothetical protein O7601_05875 [Verrucosispora sp. WMMD573]